MLDDNDTTVVLEDEEGNEVAFDAIDIINIDGQDYVILEPLDGPSPERIAAIAQDLIESGMEEDVAREAAEAIAHDDGLLPMRLDVVDGEETLFHVEEPDEYQRVMDAYDRACLEDDECYSP